MNKENLLVVPTIKFVPFRKDNILRKFETSFRITDTELKISAASAFYPATAGICQNIFEPHCFTERKSLDKTSNSKGFSDLAEGLIDMYISLASKKNLEQVQKKVKRLQCVPIFQDPLAILVNKNNPIKGLNLSQLKNIYLGKIQNWQEVGGEDLAIHNYQLTAEKNVSRNAFNLGITEREPANLPQSDIEAMPDLVLRPYVRIRPYALHHHRRSSAHFKRLSSAFRYLHVLRCGQPQNAIAPASRISRFRRRQKANRIRLPKRTASPLIKKSRGFRLGFLQFKFDADYFTLTRRMLEPTRTM